MPTQITVLVFFQSNKKCFSGSMYEVHCTDDNLFFVLDRIRTYIAMAPKTKRARFSRGLPNDPSIPLSDGLDRFSTASNDVIDHVFRRLVGVKTKMCLELVCPKFQARIKERTCWTLNDELKLEFIDGHFRINGVPFTEQRAVQALGLLLERITVRTMILGGISADIRTWVLGDEAMPRLLLWSVCSEIVKHKRSFCLRDIEFSNYGTRGDFDAQLIFSLAACDLSQVTWIHSTMPGETTGSFQNALMALFLRCENVTGVYVVMECEHLRNEFFMNGVIDILHQRPSIDYVHLVSVRGYPFSQELADDYADLANSLPSLTELGIHVADVNEFASLLTQETRFRIKGLNVATDVGAVPVAVDDFLLGVAAEFPNLGRLTVIGPPALGLETCVAVAESFFDSFGGDGERTLELEFPVLEPDKGRILYEMGKKKPNGESVEVSLHILENGVHKLIKSGLTIILRFRDME